MPKFLVYDSTGALRAVIDAIDASKITSGTLADARIPSLAASKITSGTFDVARIPNLSADKITSEILGVDRIPDLAASKITSGDLDDARLSSNVPLKDEASVISADCWAFTNGLKERGRTAKIGAWSTLAYDAGNFSCESGDWTVDSAKQQINYALIGDTVLFEFNIWDSVISATPAWLRILIPESLDSPKQIIGTYNYYYTNHLPGLITTIATGSHIYLFTAAYGAWSAGTVGMYGSFAFEGQ
jgi:hypothetical protein